MEPTNKGVLVLYTGGTIGSVPKDPNDPDSPRVSASWEELKGVVPVLNNIGFQVDAYTFDPPLDSSNMKPEYWVEMAEVIEKQYHAYEGFVIVHGTDTMAYTASALSFMLENLGKPVVITGSQIPIAGSARNDGEQNLVTSLLIANPQYTGLTLVPEVCIFFRDHLLRGNRTQKESASGYTAFVSRNYPPLAEAGEHIVIHSGLLRKPTGGPFTVHKKLDTRVISFHIFPGIQNTTILDDVLNNPEVQAIVLHTYGNGNAPSDPTFLDIIQKATDHGKIILNVTQCSVGAVELGLYDTSVGLLDRGVFSGTDITPEAALCKLMVLLGKEPLRLKDMPMQIEENHAGEQSRSLYTTLYDDQGGVDGSHPFQIAEKMVSSRWDHQHLEKALLRLRDAELDCAEQDRISITIHLQSSEDSSKTALHYAGTFSKQVGSKNSTLLFDITKTAKSFIFPGKRISFHIAVETAHANLKWKHVELVIFTRE